MSFSLSVSSALSFAFFNVKVSIRLWSSFVCSELKKAFLLTPNTFSWIGASGFFLSCNT